MSATVENTTNKRWTATELRRLPRDQREAILTAAAEAAKDEYTNDSTLTAFETFGEDDLYGLSSGPATR